MSGEQPIGEVLPGLWSTYDELGLDPMMPAARLREDLAIAARVRRCHPCAPDASYVHIDDLDDCYSSPIALLAFLKGESL